MSTDTIQERFFHAGFDLAQQAQEFSYEFPAVIVFLDQTGRVACTLTISDFGKLLNRCEWDCSGWDWEWEANRSGDDYEEPFRATLASHDGQGLSTMVPSR